MVIGDSPVGVKYKICIEDGQVMVHLPKTVDVEGFLSSVRVCKDLDLPVYSFEGLVYKEGSVTVKLDLSSKQPIYHNGKLMNGYACEHKDEPAIMVLDNVVYDRLPVKCGTVILQGYVLDSWKCELDRSLRNFINNYLVIAVGKK